MKCELQIFLYSGGDLLGMICPHGFSLVPELFLSVALPTGLQLLVFVCSSVPVVLFHTPGISRYLCCGSLLLLVLAVRTYTLVHLLCR